MGMTYAEWDRVELALKEDKRCPFWKACHFASRLWKKRGPNLLRLQELVGVKDGKVPVMAG